MISEHSCVNCHFFSKLHNRIPLEIQEDERSSIRKGDFSPIKEHYSLCCHYGVWDEGHNFDKRQRSKIIVQTDRKKFCFFFKHRPGMLLPAARILHEREVLFRESSRDRKLTIIGLWIAAIALLITAISGITKCSQKNKTATTSINTQSIKP